MADIAAAQQAEAQNATALILAAINSGLITIDEANNLTEDHIGEIGIFQTAEEVGDYVFRLFRETPEARAARRLQERAAFEQLRDNLRNEVQTRANVRADNLDNGAMGGKRRRRRRTRKTRKY